MRKTALLSVVAIVAATFFMPAIAPEKVVYAYDKLTIVGEKGTYVYDSPQIEYFYAGSSLARIDDVISEVCEKEYVPYRDAYVDFKPNAKDKFTTVAEKDGRAVDKERLKDDIIAALSVGGGAIKPVYNVVKPQIYEKDLFTDIVVRSKFSTSFAGSSAERKFNIKKALGAINGTTIEAGEEFSFNETVGKRTENSGYKNAKIISDGNFVDGVGGGVCQVSTTLYNAALLSGMTITECHPHTLGVSYVESSFDAMVNYGTCDLKFVNNTGRPAYIKCYVDNDRACVIVYGKKSDCVYLRESVVTETINADTQYIYDAALDENEYIIKTAAKNGIKSVGYLLKKVNGKITERRLIRNDFYKPVTGVIISGDRSHESAVSG